MSRVVVQAPEGLICIGFEQLMKGWPEASGMGRKTLETFKKTKPDWADLSPGDSVWVHEAKHFPYRGKVDVLTEEADVIWVCSDDGAGRRAYDQGSCH